MLYDAELKLLCAAFQKCRVQLLLIDLQENMERQMDMGLADIVGKAYRYGQPFVTQVPPMRPATVYRLQDDYGCNYLYFLLPQEERMVYIGPFLSERLSRNAVLEIAERKRLDPKSTLALEQYFGMLPVAPEDSHLFGILDAFAELIWGGAESFVIERVDADATNGFLVSSGKKEGGSAEEDLWNMQLMERRYAYENDLMYAISKGQMQRAEKMLGTFSGLSFEKRLSDPIRNFKNYCIIMNTLARKAAEQGGVHPLYLDKISSDFARRIEQIGTTAQIGVLMGEMVRSYCRLVRKYKMEKYSSPVQKSIVCIDADLTQDLTLGRLAKLQNVSPAYLSALFKKETGHTLTEYVNLKRVELAKSLLLSTDLQIQTIAQHCGILDIHYFSRVFKKYTQKTPKEYRNANDS